MIFDKSVKTSMREKNFFQQMVLVQLDIHMPKNQVRVFPYTVPQNFTKLTQKRS